MLFKEINTKKQTMDPNSKSTLSIHLELNKNIQGIITPSHLFALKSWLKSLKPHLPIKITKLINDVISSVMNIEFYYDILKNKVSTIYVNALKIKYTHTKKNISPKKSKRKYII